MKIWLQMKNNIKTLFYLIQGKRFQNGFVCSSVLIVTTGFHLALLL